MKLVLVFLTLIEAWDFVNRLGSKTAYRPQQSASNYTLPPSTCSSLPVHAEMVARHGARFATAASTKSLDALQNKLHGLPSTAPTWIRNWTSPIDPYWSDMVTDVGKQSHYEMGKRFRQNYPNLFSRPYHPNRNIFQSTWVPRAQQSGMANAFGMLEGTGSVGPTQYNPPYIFTHPIQNDTILRFFDSCPKYDDLRASYAKLIDAWGQSNLMGVVQAVQNKVSSLITYSDVLVMFQACGYEFSLKNDTTLMCSLFDDNSMAMMDLFQEFDGYFLKGPGVNLSYMISSPLVAEIITSMKNYVESKGTGTPMFLRFAHAETISPLAAYMGLFAGGPPLSFDAKPSTLFNRSWDDAQVMPYAANMLLLLYTCSDDYYVKMLYNEKETVIPGCDTLYCPWTKFFNLFRKALSFDYDATCRRNSSHSSSRSPSSSHSPSSSMTAATFSHMQANRPVPGGSCSANLGERCIPTQYSGTLCCTTGYCLQGRCRKDY